MYLAIKANSQEYCEHVLLYADNSLVSSDEADHTIRDKIGKYFVVSKWWIGQPTRHLGDSVRKALLENIAEAWAFSII